MKVRVSGILLVIFTVLLFGCGKDDNRDVGREDSKNRNNTTENTTNSPSTTTSTGSKTTDSAGNKKANVTEASAKLEPLANSKVEGEVEFKKTDAGMQIKIELSGLTPGKHGFHIHEFGDCSAPDGKSAGEHFNPGKMQHGDINSSSKHDGDMGNVTADADGKVNITLTDKMMTFDGPNSILGKSVIVHEKEDDLKTQPSGNSGNRLACGVIKAD
jgi:Cu-Zn family superoxide dismutase